MEVILTFIFIAKFRDCADYGQTGVAIEPLMAALDRIDQASDATLRAIGRLGAGWNAASLLLRLPHGMRDRIYRWVARNRYRWFGKVPVCALFSEFERRRLLP